MVKALIGTSIAFFDGSAIHQRDNFSDFQTLMEDMFVQQLA